jgi:hypothetical protein
VLRVLGSPLGKRGRPSDVRGSTGRRPRLGGVTLTRRLAEVRDVPPPRPRERHNGRLGALAQLGERRLCKPEVTGSIPVRSTDKRAANSSLLYS